jgi:hypothetical protein
MGALLGEPENVPAYPVKQDHWLMLLTIPLRLCLQISMYVWKSNVLIIIICYMLFIYSPHPQEGRKNRICCFSTMGFIP